MIARIVYLLGCILTLAGLVHIVIVLLIPHYSEQDVAKRIRKTLPIGGFHSPEKFLSEEIKGQDPFFSSIACKFDLSENSYLVQADRYADFWSASVYNAGGRVLYSLNDKTAIRNQLRVLMVNSVQWARLRKLQHPELEKSIVVEMNSETGFVVLRALLRDDSFGKEATRFLASARCEPFESG